MGSKTHRKAWTLAAAFWFAQYSLAMIAQQPIGHPPAPPVVGTAHPSRQRLSYAIGTAAEYLERKCDTRGEFAYLVDTDSGEVSPSYNIIRHAGAIYALAMFNRLHPDSNAVGAMARAANFMRANYMAPDHRSNALAIWSRPPPAKTKAELGAAGLGLVALASVEQAKPNTIPIAQLESLGRFVLFLQRPDGSFYSRYLADTGPDRNWQSLYYPGEAALGLISLYELDHSREWLTAAGRALSYLARSRTGPQELPLDHWALIATAKFLPYYDRSACPASRAELMRHATRICDRLLRGQITNAPDARLNGAFESSGKDRAGGHSIGRAARRARISAEERRGSARANRNGSATWNRLSYECPNCLWAVRWRDAGSGA